MWQVVSRASLVHAELALVASKKKSRFNCFALLTATIHAVRANVSVSDHSVLVSSTSLYGPQHSLSADLRVRVLIVLIRRNISSDSGGISLRGTSLPSVQESLGNYIEHH